ncbi:MAG: hypothetical protein H0W83_11245 [Planctomycetes bacterium]|nr:hypothetical protein [Planctomycetota bacterium]
MRYSLIILIVAMVLSLGMSYLWNPVRIAQNSDNPIADLHAMTQQDPDLERALQHADNRDISDLVKWINRADILQRQRLAMLLYILVAPKDSEGMRQQDPDQVYRYRERFRAFLTLGTGDDRLDIQLENLLAYSVIISPETPTEQDIALANLLVPRLRRAATEYAEDAYWDTVGCALFASGEYANAKEAFSNARKLAHESKDKRKRTNEELYTRRLEATEHNLQLKAENSAEAVVPLPRESKAIAKTAHAPAAKPGREATSGSPTATESAKP